MEAARGACNVTAVSPLSRGVAPGLGGVPASVSLLQPPAGC